MVDRVHIEARLVLRERFEARLRTELVLEGHVSTEQMQAALERQVTQGAHLSTNLWELGFVEGPVLTRLSCALLGITAVAPRTILSATPRVFRTLPVQLIQEEQILPFHIEGHTLHVAMAQPWDLPTLEKAERLCGHSVRPHFLGEVPMARVLHRVLGVPISARFELGRRLFQGSKGAKARADAPRGDLIDESSFQALYAGRSDPAAPVAPSPVPSGQAAPGDAPRNAGPSPAISPPPAAASPAEPSSPEALSLPDDDFDALGDLEIDEAPMEIEEPILDLSPEDIVPLTPDVSLVPLEDLAEATALLEAASSRNAVGEVLVRFGLSRGERVALFTLDGDTWAGWTGTGIGVDVRAIESLMLPAEEGTVFGLVASTGSHFLGPLQPHETHRRFLSVLGEGEPTTVGFFPVRYRGRVVFGVYLDGGGGQTVSVDIAEILLLAQRVPGALEALVTRRMA